MKVLELYDLGIRIEPHSYSISMKVTLDTLVNQQQLQNTIIEELIRPKLPMWFIKLEYIANTIKRVAESIEVDGIAGGYHYWHVTPSTPRGWVNNLTPPITTTTASPSNRNPASSNWDLHRYIRYYNEPVPVDAPSSFDDIAQVLAVRVLENDTTAARVLHDRMCELVETGRV